MKIAFLLILAGLLTLSSCVTRDDSHPKTKHVHADGSVHYH